MAAGQDVLTPGTVVVAKVDEIQLGVGEVDSVGGGVQSETVGPVDFRADDDGTIRTVHADTFDARVLAPVGPEEPSSAERDIIIPLKIIILVN